MRILDTLTTSSQLCSFFIYSRGTKDDYKRDWNDKCLINQQVEIITVLDVTRCGCCLAL